jgi:uncharacterized protein Usg
MLYARFTADTAPTRRVIGTYGAFTLEHARRTAGEWRDLITDHRWLLQSYVWQNYDLFPEFPELHRFLAFWQKKLDGPLHSVRVAHCKLIKPAELKAISGEFRLH